jgi:hypothetical protein
MILFAKFWLAGHSEGRRGRRLDGLQGVGDAQGALELGLHRLFERCVAFLLDVDQVLPGRVEDEEGELSLFVGLLLQPVSEFGTSEHDARVSDRLAGLVVENVAEDCAISRSLSLLRGPAAEAPSDRNVNAAAANANTNDPKNALSFILISLNDLSSQK